MRTALHVLPLTLAACFPNPAFDPPGASTDDPKTTTATPPTTSTTGPGLPTTTDTSTTSSSSTSTSGDDTTIGLAESSTGTSTTPATTTTTGDSSTGTTTTGASSTGDTDTDTEQPPTNCWAQDPDTWLAPPIHLDQFADAKPHDPVLSLDGKTLVYLAGNDPEPRLSKRSNLGDNFPNGAPFVLWNYDSLVPGYLRFDLARNEMLLSSNNDLYTATFQPFDVNMQYTQPVILPGAVNTGLDETITGITEDGKTLIVQRNDGSQISDEIKSSWNFYQFDRKDPAPGVEFKDAKKVTPEVLPLKLALCPTLSADGLHLFFASTSSTMLTIASAPDLVRIFHTDRDDRDAEWNDSTELTTIAPGGNVLCPTSVSADGCVLSYIKFPFGPSNTPYAMYVVERPL